MNKTKRRPEILSDSSTAMRCNSIAENKVLNFYDFYFLVTFSHFELMKQVMILSYTGNRIYSVKLEASLKHPLCLRQQK